MELQRKLIAQEMITLNLQKSLFTDSKKLALIELKIIEKEKALEELSKSQEKALEELSEAQRKRSNPINLDPLASINTSVTLPSIGGEQKIQNPTKSRDHRPSPEGEEKIAIKERIQELQTQIELEDDENAKHVLTIEKLRAEQSLSSSWSDFMLIRDKIIRMKKEWEKKIEELKKEKQKSPEQIKKEISAQIALYKAAIAALESKAIRPNLKNKSKLRADIDKKKLAIERLSERRGR